MPEVPAGVAARVDERAVVVECAERQGRAEGDGDTAELDVREPRQRQGVGVTVADDRDRRFDQRHQLGAQVALRPRGGARHDDPPAVRVDVAVQRYPDPGGGAVDGEDRGGEILGGRDLGTVDAHHVAVHHGTDPRPAAADVHDHAVAHRRTSLFRAYILPTYS
ncbi:hypothetical protein [Dietzia cinnamea]|uniref:hypothetical protein n=1 Tax=Dietzia cinnamea TaxID=321318 RepID=UPI00223B9C7F|nr:hypothetical protein [Dietzia cinnamea]MCT2062397.1 hypothetical protein [Dietzia cinnamea]MCT2235290.1 hypothetical protein [Dietzia cinnamea]MCT2300362.1 hypothetical protein [Dietzia cinnamea]